MSHERIKGFFSLENVFRNSENVTLSVFLYNCSWHQMIDNRLKQCFMIYMRPPSSISKCKEGKSPAHANRLGKYVCRLSVKSKRCSKTVTYETAFETHSRNCMLLLLSVNLKNKRSNRV